MSDHLPECPVWRCCKPDERATMHTCICKAGFVKDYAAALDAARKAVAALRGCIGTDGNGDGTVWVEKADVLDAIDALREGKT